MHAARLPLAMSLALFALVACRDAPEIVYGNARQALQSRDDAAFLDLLEPRSRTLLEAAPGVVSQSGRAFRVLRDGKPSPALLPKGEVKEAIERGRRAEVVVVQGNRKVSVPMRLVEGQWRIDLLDMDAFYANLRPPAAE
ncbi:MAG: hypothetical protein EXR79_08575 [Myxococcales bacterium]|nr:hypothetical protein [Myxococcales bacterium]